MEQNVKARSGMKIDRNPQHEPVEIFRVDKDRIKVHTLDTVECVDVDGWDDHVPSVTDYVPYLDDDETDGDEVIEEVNIGFKPHLVPVPKTGYIGYVKVESKHYEGPKVEPRLFEMEEHEYEAIR